MLKIVIYISTINLIRCRAIYNYKFYTHCVLLYYQLILNYKLQIFKICKKYLQIPRVIGEPANKLMGNNQQLPRNDIQRPSPISVNDSSNPFTWNLKFASRIVDYVVQFCRNKYSINVRWHVQEYLSSSGDDGDDLVDINYAYLDRALIFEVYIFFKYFNIFGYTYIMTNQPIDQPLFDAAILTIYEEYLLVHYTPYLNYELAVAIALFAVYASQSGFSDALYHAVPAIIAKARALAVNNLTNPLQNL